MSNTPPPLSKKNQETVSAMQQAIEVMLATARTELQTQKKEHDDYIQSTEQSLQTNKDAMITEIEKWLSQQQTAMVGEIEKDHATKLTDFTTEVTKVVGDFKATYETALKKVDDTYRAGATYTKIAAFETTLVGLKNDTQNELKGFQKKWGEEHSKLHERWQTDCAANEADYKSKVKEFENTIATFSSELEANIDKKTTEMAKHLTILNEAAGKANDQVTKALDGATQFGLANAFGTKHKALQPSYWIWGGVAVLAFISLGLVGFAFYNDEEELTLVRLVSRVMVTLPLGGLVWFTIMQFGKISDIQTKYAFKEAMSNAFLGYKKEAGEADEKFIHTLLEDTLKVVTEDPMEAFYKNKHHSTPTHEMVSIMKEINKMLKRFPSADVPGIVSLVVNQLSKGVEAPSQDDDEE